jgi:hypothetical protein
MMMTFIAAAAALIGAHAVTMWFDERYGSQKLELVTLTPVPISARVP